MKELQESELIEISLEQLKGEEIFPFHLYIYNPNKKSYTLYLNANTPLTEQKIIFIQYILQRKGKLAIAKSQKMTFLQHMDYEESELSSPPSLNSPAPSEKKENDSEQEGVDKEGEEISEKPAKSENLNAANIVIDFSFEEEFIEADHDDDYSRIIRAMKDEVQKFSYKISHTVSLAKYYVETLCLEDNLTNRVVSLSYFLAKEANIKKQEELADIIVAGFLYHLGLTQIDIKLSSSAQMEMGDEMKKEYRKHLGLSQHLIRKSGLDISNRCRNIINQHHERSDGHGYPNQKTVHQIDPLALILGCASHLIEYSFGLIDGKKQMILPLIKIIESGGHKPGLEKEFGDHILASIIEIIKSEFDSTRDAA